MNRVILQRAGCALRGTLRMVVAAWIFLLAAMVVAVPAARAEDGTGVTILGPCMGDLFHGTLGCTANDVRISGVADVTGDGVVNEEDITFAPVCDAGSLNVGADCSADPAICLNYNNQPTPALCGDRCAYPGDTTKFAATFIVMLSAQERYDIGLYFAVDGDPNRDGALTGTCSISTLPEIGSFSRPDGSSGSFVDLDSTCTGRRCPQPEDLCGDINDGANPIYFDLSASPATFISAWCVDLDVDGMLNLPNCTSWRQSGANEVCLGPAVAFPGAPSKCNCDPTFEVPIDIPPAELKVVKTASPTQLNEPGGTILYQVSVTNLGIDPNNDVTLLSLSDDVYGNLDADDVGGHTWLTSTCLEDADGPAFITPGGTYTCAFTAPLVGGGGSFHVDVVTAEGIDDYGNAISGEDDAVVELLDVLPAISVLKTASPTSVLEGSQSVVTFEVVVDNLSPADPVTLTALFDDIYGDITLVQGGILATSCSLVTIPVGQSYLCSFSAVVDGPAFWSETDTVLALGHDDEGNPVEASDSATVTILDDVAVIELVKVASPTMVNEPGADVTYTFTVTNLSSVDTVTITDLFDDIYGDLAAFPGSSCTVPLVMAPGSTYVCSVSALVLGAAGDVVTNVATATGVDDDGKPVMASDDASVTILDVPPAASLTKTVTSMIVTYQVHVTNDSPVEPLTLESLVDDQFGDITLVQGDIVSTDCAVAQLIPVGGSYWCSFDALVDSSPHVDTVTGTLSDDDGGQTTPSDSEEVTFGNPAP